MHIHRKFFFKRKKERKSMEINLFPKIITYLFMILNLKKKKNNLKTIAHIQYI